MFLNHSRVPSPLLVSFYFEANYFPNNAIKWFNFFAKWKFNPSAIDFSNFWRDKTAIKLKKMKKKKGRWNRDFFIVSPLLVSFDFEANYFPNNAIKWFNFFAKWKFNHSAIDFSNFWRDKIAIKLKKMKKKKDSWNCDFLIVSPVLSPLFGKF